jgi:hypothetical protein
MNTGSTRDFFYFPFRREKKIGRTQSPRSNAIKKNSVPERPFASLPPYFFLRFSEIFWVEIFSVLFFTPHAEKRPKTRSKQGPFFCFLAVSPQ